MSKALVKYKAESKLGSALNVAGQIVQYAKSQKGQHMIKKATKAAGHAVSFISKSWEHMRDTFGGKPSSNAAGAFSVPTKMGVNTGGFKWNFGKAPDVGLGPGLRLYVRCRGPALLTSASQTATASGFYDTTNSVMRPYLMLDPSVANVAGATITYPAMFQAVSGIYNMVKLFERYLIRHVTLEVSPLKSTATDGSMALGQYHDAVRADVQYSVVSTTNYDRISGLLNSCSFPVWEPYRFQALHVPDKAAISPADLLWIHTDDSPAVGQDSGRLVVQGAIACDMVGTVVSTQYSTTMLEVCLDLYCPATVSTGVQLDEKDEKQMRDYFHRHNRTTSVLYPQSATDTQKLQNDLNELKKVILASDSHDKPKSENTRESKGKDSSGSSIREEQQPLGGPAVLVRSVDNTHTPPNTPQLVTQIAQSVVPRNLTRSSLW
jgi:hypothetical protein